MGSIEGLGARRRYETVAARAGKLEDQEAWLKERFLRHRGNVGVVRQDLLREQSIGVSLSEPLQKTRHASLVSIDESPDRGARW